MQKLIKEVDEKRGIVQVTVGDERWYFKDGKDPVTKNPIMLSVPSVTWIAGHYPKGIMFYKWLADKGWDEAEAIKQAAGDKGSKVHEALSAIFRGEEVRIDSKFTNKSTGELEELTFEECECIKSFIDWRATLKSFEPVAWDIVVFSEEHDYAGTIDLVAKVDGELYIIDFKTSQYVWTEYELQVSAYKHGLQEQENGEGKGTNPYKLAILQLGYRRNKGKFKFTEIEDAFDLFKVAQSIWVRETEGTEPRKVELPIVLSPAVKVEEAIEEKSAKQEESIPVPITRPRPSKNSKEK